MNGRSPQHLRRQPGPARSVVALQGGGDALLVTQLAVLIQHGGGVSRLVRVDADGHRHVGAFLEGRPRHRGGHADFGHEQSSVEPVGCANSGVSRELGFRDASVGTVALLLPLLRTPGVVEARLPHAVPLRPAARPAGPRRRRQGPGDPRPAPPTRRPPPADPTSQAGVRRPRHARCSQPRAAPSPLVVLLGQARDAVALASAAGGRRGRIRTARPAGRRWTRRCSS